MNTRLFSTLFLLALVFGALPASAATVQSNIEVTTVTFEKGAKAPTCKVVFTYKKPRVGESTTLLWRSHGADYMTGLYTTEMQETRGSQNIIFGHAGVQNFELTFTGPGGTTTCSQRIYVKERLETK